MEKIYSKPTLNRLGTMRELTQAGGEFACSDGGNPYHRYGVPCGTGG